MRAGSTLITLSLCLLASASLRRDAGTQISKGLHKTIGQNHHPLIIPSGARLKSIPVGSDGAEVAVYWNDPIANQSQDARSAYIMVHGKLRNGNSYWGIMDHALKSAVDEEFPSVDPNAFVVAPQFFSEAYNKGQYTDEQLAFGDVNAWAAGDVATHPAGTNLSSLDALDAILATFANKTMYPNIANITLVGHGGGGQLITRYAAVGSVPTGVHVRFIVGDPSSHAYFTDDRPISYEMKGKNCAYSNAWRYGYDNFPGTAAGLKTPEQYFADYINRDVVLVVANDDVKSDGDQHCPARMQGGVARRDRNLAWWTYINLLARTLDPVHLLNIANFTTTLPDWSWTVGSSGQIGPRLVVIEDVDHDAEMVFGSKEGRAALFAWHHIPCGWRPEGYKEVMVDVQIELGLLNGKISLRADTKEVNAPFRNVPQPKDWVSDQIYGPAL